MTPAWSGISAFPKCDPMFFLRLILWHLKWDGSYYALETAKRWQIILCIVKWTKIHCLTSTHFSLDTGSTFLANQLDSTIYVLTLISLGYFLSEFQWKWFKKKDKWFRLLGRVFHNLYLRLEKCYPSVLYQF